MFLSENHKPYSTDFGNLIYEVNADTQAKELMEGRRRYREQLATSYAAGEIKARKELSAIIADKDATIADKDATITKLQAELEKYKRNS